VERAAATAEKKRKKAAMISTSSKRRVITPVGVLSEERACLAVETQGKGEHNTEEDNIPESVGDTDAQRRSKYFAPTQVVNTKPSTHTLDAAMDDFVNAQHRGMQCRRAVPQAYFGNKERARSESHVTPGCSLLTCRVTDSDHSLCDESLLTGCARCGPGSTTICCDVCTPAAFAFLSVISKPAKV
jgi:hypothetical protein